MTALAGRDILKQVVVAADAPSIQKDWTDPLGGCSLIWAYSKGERHVSVMLAPPVRALVESKRQETVAEEPTAAEVPQISTDFNLTEAKMDAADVAVVATITDWTKFSKVTA